MFYGKLIHFYSMINEKINGETKTNYYLPDCLKNSDLQLAKIDVDVKNGPDWTTIVLTSDKPAFFVFLEADKVNKFSDNS